MKARIVDFLLDNALLSPFVTFGVLLLAIATASLPLLFVSGILAYGWAFFYVYLLDLREKSASEHDGPLKRLRSIRRHCLSANT